MAEHEIALAAREIDEPHARRTFLEAECRGDTLLLTRIMALLNSESREGDEQAFAPTRQSESSGTSTLADSTPPDQGEPLPPTTASPDPRDPATVHERASPPPTRAGSTIGPRCGPMAEGPGSRIGPYRLIRKVGEGGMGVVFLSEQERPVRREVAVKIIKPGMASADVISRFEAERQALALMSHPNIARVFDAGTTESGLPYFVMEYVEGPPITRYCDDRRLTTRERLELFLPVCKAIQHAHQKGVIHRDVKPSNVLVPTYDGVPLPKVIDFGLAKAVDQRLTERTLLTAFGAFVGTPEYVSPEQVELGSVDVDTRSDVYSLGVLLFELLTGTTPLERSRTRTAGPAEIYQLIRTHEPPTPSRRLATLGAELPTIAGTRGDEPGALIRTVKGELDWIVMKALERDRTRRYQTANGLARDVERYLANEMVDAGPPSAGYRVGKFVRKHRATLVTLTAFAALLVLGTVFSSWQAIRARWAEKEARNQQSVAEAEADATREVNQFLEDLLRAASAENQAGPGTSPDPDLKVRTVLDRAAGSIAGRFQGRPLVESSIRQTIGDTYRGLGLFESAKPHLERALDLRSRAQGPDHPKTLSALAGLALLYRSWGKFDEARAAMERVVRGRQRVLGAEHTETLAASDELAIVVLSQGHSAEAEAMFLKVLEARRRLSGDDAPSTLTTRNNLALAHQAQGKLEEAGKGFRAALEGRRTRLGGAHPLTLTTMNNLARLHRDQGNHDKAESLYLDVLKVRRAVLGPEHPETLTSLSNLALNYLDQARLSKAEPLLLEVLELRRRVLGPERPDTLTTFNNLAMLHRDQGKYAEAERNFLDVLDVRRRVQGPGHPHTLIAMENLAMTYRDEGMLDRAEKLILEELDTLRSVQGPDHLDTLTTMNALARVYLDQGRASDAAPLVTASLDGLRRALRKDHPYTLASLHTQALLQRHLGSLDEAGSTLNGLIEARRLAYGENHPQTLRVRDDLALIFSDRGRLPEAEELLRTTLSAREGVRGADHPQTLATSHALALVLWERGQIDEADRRLRDVLERRKRVLDADHPQVAETLLALGKLRLAQGNHEEAEALVREGLAVLERRQPDHWTRFQALSLLGAVLLAEGHLEEAEPRLVQGYLGLSQRRERVPAPLRENRLLEAGMRLVELYEAWGPRDRSLEWQKRLATQPRDEGP